MDNLTHSLVGWALAETGLKRRTRKGLAACVLAANMPDIDVIFGWVPWAPLATHRGFTHGLVGGVLLMPPILAGLLWLLDRWQVRRGRVFDDGLQMRAGWLVVLSYLGAITHPLLDLQNVYAVQLLSPASTHWFHSDSLFIVSPWLLAMLTSGIWLARRWNSGRPAQAALVASVLFILANVGISLLAYRAPRLSPPYATPDRMFASPEALAFWRRDLVWREAGTISFARYDPLHSLTNVLGPISSTADHMEDPVATRAASATPEVAKFLGWSQMPVARIAREGCSTIVTFGDARFSGPAVSRSFNVAVKLSPDTGCRPAR